MGSKRKSREEINKEDIDLLKPINISLLGSDEDPCFGKLHDLVAKECRSCGDSEFCAIVKAQGLHKERLDIESNQRFKDIEEADSDMVNKKEEAIALIKDYKEMRLPRMKIVIKVAKEKNLPKEIVKQLYNQI